MKQTEDWKSTGEKRDIKFSYLGLTDLVTREELFGVSRLTGQIPIIPTSISTFHSLRRARGCIVIYIKRVWGDWSKDSLRRFRWG